MKKDLIFSPILLAIGVLLCLLKATGIVAHVVISVIGLAGLVVYAVLTKKEWKIPALEIIMRVLYGIALITGIVIMNASGLVALAVIHKVSAVFFVVLLGVLTAHKLIGAKKAQSEKGISDETSMGS